MGVIEQFSAAFACLDATQGQDESALAARLAGACVSALPIAGAGISVRGGFAADTPVGASDATAACAEQLQYTWSHGPSLGSDRRLAIVVAEPAIARYWPLFYARLSTETPYRALIVVPLSTRWTEVGTLTLFCYRSSDLLALRQSDISSIASRMSAAMLLARPSLGYSLTPAWQDGQSSEGRRQVLVAIGKLTEQFKLDPQDALALLRAHAWATGGTVSGVAGDIIRGRLPIAELRLDNDC